MDTHSAKTVFLTASQVLDRYGRTGKHRSTWLHRRLRKDPDFPRPLYIAGNRYWSLADLVAYETAPERRVAPKRTDNMPHAHEALRRAREERQQDQGAAE